MFAACGSLLHSCSDRVEIERKTLGTKSKEGHSAVFDIPFTDGENILEAYGSDGVTDILRVDFRMIPGLSKFKRSM